MNINRNHNRKYESDAGMNRKSHDHGTENNKRAAQKQPQKHIQSVLHLINITGHTSNQRAGTYPIHFRKIQRLNMGKQMMS